MTTTHNQARHAGLANCREYRRLLGHATSLYTQAKNRHQPRHAHYWRVSAADWYQRLQREQLALSALRRGGVLAWQSHIAAAGMLEVHHDLGNTPTAY